MGFIDKETEAQSRRAWPRLTVGGKTRTQVSSQPVQALLHLACLLEYAPCDWDQEPSSESMVTELCCLMKDKETSYPCLPDLGSYPVAGFPTISLVNRDR